MGFGTGKFAKIWTLENKGNYHIADMQTSKKKKDASGNDVMENGKAVYEKDWSHKFVRLVGNAHKQALSLSDGDNVKIGACDVTNNYDKEKKVTYTNYVIFGFEDNQMTNNGGNKPTSSQTDNKGFMNVPDGIDEELPFN